MGCDFIPIKTLPLLSILPSFFPNKKALTTYWGRGKEDDANVNGFNPLANSSDNKTLHYCFIPQSLIGVYSSNTYIWNIYHMPVIELNTGTCQGDLQGPLPCYSLQVPQSEEADSKQKTTMKKNKLGKQYIPDVKATVIKTMCFCSKDYWNRKKIQK